MGNQDLVVLIVLVVVLGVCTEFIMFNPGQLGLFLVPVIGLGYTYWTRHSGKSNTSNNNGNEKSSLP